MKFPTIEPLEARIAPATVSFANSSFSTTEGTNGTTTLNFTVTLSEAVNDSQVTVSFSTSDGTAVSTAPFPDFVAQSGTTVTFEPGETSKDVSVQITSDVFDESDESFTATLTNVSSGHAIGTSTATGTITDDDAAATIQIVNNGAVTEGDGVTSNFTITLSHATETATTVNFATVAGTAKPAPGAFTDYITKTGTITFAAGATQLTQTISIDILNDSFRELTEAFTVTLSNESGATVAVRTATGTINNDSDTVTGLALPDVQKVEGDASNTVSLVPTLSAPLSAGQDVTVKLSTVGATAVAGSDFTGVSQVEVKITGGQLSASTPITILGDNVFEGAESFFVNMTTTSTDVTVVNDHPLYPAAQATARVYILNDDIQALASNSLRWSDLDGDIVTMTVSKGSFFDVFGGLLTGLATFTDPNSVGGIQLQVLDLVGSSGVSFGSRFAGANVTITATPDVGSPLDSDGRVDVGLIQAALFVTQELQVIGVDLGAVTIDGDLARITAGDQFSTTAIRTLDVYSLGAKPGSLIPDPSATSTTMRTQSDVLGPVGALKVKTNVEGYLHVIGAEFGTIGTVNIEGDLKGGAPASSGRITASGRIGSATIGNIIGGSGNLSGVISGTPETGGKLGNVTVFGDVIGGSGASSGEIFSSSTIGVIKIGGKLSGGTGEDSGSIQSGGTITSLTLGTLVGNSGKGSGSVRVGVNNSGSATSFGGNIGAVNITGQDVSDDSIKGGAGINSGRIDVIGSIASLTVAGDVAGGSGSGSGAILNRAAIGAIKIGGSLVGSSGENSGSIQSGGNITSLSLETLVGDTGKGSGSVRAGVNNAGTATAATGNIGAINITGKNATTNDSILGGTGINSGRVDALGSILSLTVAGDIQGSTTGGAGSGNGAIFNRSTIGAIKITGSLAGGAGEDSGSIQSGGSVTSLSLGTLVGGDGKGSGSVRVGVNNASAATVSLANLGAVNITEKAAITNDSILGGGGINSGRIDVLGSILSINVAGDIQGGAGSGAGNGSIVSKSTIGAIKISGNITGTTGENSGSIQSTGKVTSLNVGYLAGGLGKGSGAVRVGVDNSGTVLSTTGSIGTVNFVSKNGSDSLLGGAGVNSGRLEVAGSIANVSVNGDVHGGGGNGSGSIVARANIDKLLISGSLLGADSTAAALNTSGAIKANWLKSATIAGDIVAGKKTGAGTITSSGAIVAGKIDLLKVDGKLTGDTTNPVLISATGLFGDLAIKSVTVTGAVEYATIRAGYSDSAATSADASIGNVVFGSTVRALNLVAGAQAGTDGRFGTADDAVVSGTGVKNAAGIVSKIASVIFKNGQPIIADPAGYGIVAQQIAAITVGTAKITALVSGPGNNLTPIEIASGTQFRAVELAVP